MRRLTQRMGKKTYVTEDLCNLCAYNKEHHSTFCENTLCESAKDRSCPYLRVIDRLADYEDSNLTPGATNALKAELESSKQEIQHLKRVLREHGVLSYINKHGKAVWLD